MSDVDCPYCGAGQVINHDDGYGYEEDETHRQECVDCEKTFVFHTQVYFYYDANRADCLNGGEHRWRKLHIAPDWWPDARACSDCGVKERGEIDEEKKQEFLSRPVGSFIGDCRVEKNG